MIAPGHALAPSAARDPVAYCRAVGTLDQPDRRYRGPKTTPWMQTPFGAPPAAGAAPPPLTWRCMDHQVYVCAYGANIPCDSKGDANRRPQPGMADFCHDNPGADSIPAAVTGHETLYQWRCKGAKPVAGGGLKLDRRGYVKTFWKPAHP